MTTTSPTGLNLETARRLFGEMEADIDFGLIESYYHPDVRFRDPIQALEGRAAFIEMSRRLDDRCGELRVRVNDAAQTGRIILLQWTMEMKLGFAPPVAPPDHDSRSSGNTPPAKLGHA